MLSSPDRHHRSLLFGASALAFLLVLTATLQYRWLGQVGEADAARLRADARDRAEQLARDFDLEITRAFLWLRVDGETAVKRDGLRFAQRWARWSRLSRHPAIVQGVYAAREDTLLRFDPSSSSFQPAPWPRPLLRVRERIRALGHLPSRPPGAPSPPVPDLVDDEAPALVGPILLFRPESGRRLDRRWGAIPPFSSFSIVQLDGPYLRERLLPKLARRYFGTPGESEYTIVVERRSEPGAIVFRSDPGAEAREQGGAATASLFDIRFGELGPEDAAGLAELARPPGGGRAAVPFTTFGPARPPAAGPRGDAGRWRLVVRHRAGPVDAVVAAARRRNLAAAASMLVLLAATAVLIVASAQRARRLADRQVEFVAGVSHELRTPLAVICSAGENLADGVVDQGGMVTQYGRLVRDEGRRLTEMVEGVLDLAGTYSGRRRWCAEDVSVLELLVDCMAATLPALREAGLRIESHVEPGLPRVRADRGALARAVQNLLQNAIRHGGEGGWIGLRAGPSGGASRMEIAITVEDRGPGVPASEAGHIFEPFFRGTRAVERQVRGTGLGLSLVKRIVEAHGGTVSVKSEAGRGSAFTIALPALAATRTNTEPAYGTAHTPG